MIEFHSLGGSSIRCNGSECTGLSAHKQKVALLFYLAVEGPVARSSLYPLFWPQREEEKARHSLSQLLYALRQELGEEHFAVTGEQVGLALGAVAVDLKEYEAAAAAERWDEVIELYRGPFLDQFHLPGSPEFDEWRTRTRAWVSTLARRAFGRVVEARAAAGDVAGALAVASRWVNLEPLEDEAQHALIALLAMSGDRAAALSQFEAYRKRLVADLELEPLEATAALVEQIGSGELPESPLLESALSGAEVVADYDRGAPVVSDLEAEPVIPPVDLESLLEEELGERLQIERKLSESSTAIVYLARGLAPRRLVALKVFAPRRAPDRRARLRFEREVQAVASLTHPNIAAVHWAGALSNGLPYYVMQYVEGESLADKLQAEGKLSISEARRILAGVASALAAAHRRGIVHRDLQPANVLYEEETGRALLADFGLAAILRAEDMPTPITRSGELVGDTAWMSPERLKGEAVSDRSDVYGLGLLGYALLADEGPFIAASKQELYSAQLNQPPRKLAELRTAVDSDMAGLLERCLAKDPLSRPTAARVAQVLSSPATEDLARDDTPRGWFQHLLERRVPHFVGVYLAIGFGLFELIETAVGWRALASHAMPLYLASYFLGVAIVSVLSWFHGKKGPQKFEKIELLLLGSAILLWVVVGAAILLLF
ncbi:MAG: protein kinase [Gemmatimonadetes bacterium]|nr:protein kinase [Gemmatimonadota bacterium]